MAFFVTVGSSKAERQGMAEMENRYFIEVKQGGKPLFFFFSQFGLSDLDDCLTHRADDAFAFEDQDEAEDICELLRNAGYWADVNVSQRFTGRRSPSPVLQLIAAE